MDRNDAPASETPAEEKATATGAAPVSEAKVAASIFDDDGDDDAPASSGVPAAAKSDAEPAKDGDNPAGDGKDNKPAWRQDWREALAGGDEKRLAELKRYASMDAWAKSQFGLRQKLSSGEYVRKPAANASEEEKAKWREDMNIPKSADAYEMPKLEGYEFSDADKPLIKEFLSALHEADTPQPIASKALEWYGSFVQKQNEQIYQTDVADKQSVEDALRSEWDKEYRPNLNLIGRYLKDQEVLPQGFAQKLNSARTADGHRLINDPEVANWLLSLAKDRYGAGAMLYGDAKVQTSGRLDEIDKILATDPQRYFRENLGDEAMELRRKLEKAEGKKR